MDGKVLVAFASKYGNTAEIAGRIGQVLREAGLQTDVLPANPVKKSTGYQAVVLGSAVYIGMWRKEAASFLKANKMDMAQKPVWLFSSGPTGEGDLEVLLQDWKFPSGLQSAADWIQPRSITVFRGAVNLQKLNGLEKWMMNRVQAAEGDFRDWENIVAWAKGIADELLMEKEKK
ncbi:MAG: flavodoxin domain-containing protein [Anaerolineaceae bacterium]|nr:flavodoxin domain-containing protein [Anaerolineaceae bacterium]